MTEEPYNDQSTIMTWHSPWVHSHLTEEPIEMKPARVLVVEDAMCIQRSVGALLRKMHMLVDMAEDGQVACKMADRSLVENMPYDLILMDMQMPKMNGRDATRLLREHGWNRPIIAVSVAPEDEGYEDSINIGCDDYIGKPVTEQKLRNVLEQFLKALPPAPDTPEDAANR